MLSLVKRLASDKETLKKGKLTRRPEGLGIPWRWERVALSPAELLLYIRGHEVVMGSPVGAGLLWKDPCRVYHVLRKALTLPRDAQRVE
jgi:hypothetical protein